MNEFRIFVDNTFVGYVFANDWSDACKKAEEIVGDKHFDVEYVNND